MNPIVRTSHSGYLLNLCLMVTLSLFFLSAPTISAATSEEKYLTDIPDPEDNSSWNLALDEQGVKIYKRHWPGSSFSAVKTEQIINASLTQVVANFLKVEEYPSWINRCLKAKLVKDFDENGKRIIYLAIDAPWPVKNRDIAIGQRLTQDPDTKAITIHEWNEAKSLPEQDGFLRVPRNIAEFHFIPVGKNKVKSIWQGHSEPGGLIPAFVVNWMIKNIFLESTLALRHRLETVQFEPPTGKPGSAQWNGLKNIKLD